jgi:hypothetical protein
MPSIARGHLLGDITTLQVATRGSACKPPHHRICVEVALLQVHAVEVGPRLWVMPLSARDLRFLEWYLQNSRKRIVLRSRDELWVSLELARAVMSRGFTGESMRVQGLRNQRH